MTILSRRQLIVGSSAAMLAPMITVREAQAILGTITCQNPDGSTFSCQVDISFEFGLSPPVGTNISPGALGGFQQNNGGFMVGSGGTLRGQSVSPYNAYQPGAATFSNSLFKGAVSPVVYNVSPGSVTDSMNDSLRHALQFLGGSMAHNNAGSGWNGKAGTAGLRKDEKPRGREALRACAKGVGVLRSECGLSYDRAARYAAFLVRGVNDYFGPGVTRKRANVLMQNVVFGPAGPTLRQVYLAILSRFKAVGKRVGHQLDLMTSVTDLIGNDPEMVAIAHMLVTNWLGETLDGTLIDPFLSRFDMEDFADDLLEDMRFAVSNIRVDVDSDAFDVLHRDPNRYYRKVQNIFARWKNRPSAVVSLKVDVNDNLVTRDAAGTPKVW